MPRNECIVLFEPGRRITGYTTAAVVGKTFAAISAATSDRLLIGNDENMRVATAGAGARAIGVFAYDAARNVNVPVLNGPGMVVPVTTGEAISAGNLISSDASGRAVRATTTRADFDARTLTLGTHVIGVAVDDAASGADCPVRLFT